MDQEFCDNQAEHEGGIKSQFNKLQVVGVLLTSKIKLEMFKGGLNQIQFNCSICVHMYSLIIDLNA